MLTQVYIVALFSALTFFGAFSSCSSSSANSLKSSASSLNDEKGRPSNDRAAKRGDSPPSNVTASLEDNDDVLSLGKLLFSTSLENFTHLSYIEGPRKYPTLAWPESIGCIDFPGPQWAFDPACDRLYFGLSNYLEHGWFTSKSGMILEPLFLRDLIYTCECHPGIAEHSDALEKCKSSARVMSGSLRQKFQGKFQRRNSSTVSQSEAERRATDKLLFRIPLEKITEISKESKKTGSYQGLIWETDGCSKAPEYEFHEACIRHDFGYRNYKAQHRFTHTARKNIDNNFKDDMHGICNNFGFFRRLLCKRSARLYYEVVEHFGHRQRQTILHTRVLMEENGGEYALFFVCDVNITVQIGAKEHKTGTIR